MTGEEVGRLVAAELLEWVGTPLHRQQWRKGAGCDCKGMFAGAAMELGLAEGRSLHALATDYTLSRVDHRRLIRGLEELFDRGQPGEDLKPGWILLLKVGDRPVHLAGVIDPEGRGKVVAALDGQGPRARVREATLGATLRRWPLHSFWKWRDR